MPLVILTILLFGIVGAVLFRVGADDKPHGVLLKWTPPGSKAGATVSSYRVYRSQADRTYLPIATVTTPTYIDQATIPGTSYSYFVTSLDAAGHESPPSNYVSVAP